MKFLILISMLIAGFGAAHADCTNDEIFNIFNIAEKGATVVSPGVGTFQCYSGTNSGGYLRNDATPGTFSLEGECTWGNEFFRWTMPPMNFSAPHDDLNKISDLTVDGKKVGEFQNGGQNGIASEAVMHFSMSDGGLGVSGYVEFQCAPYPYGTTVSFELIRMMPNGFRKFSGTANRQLPMSSIKR